MYINGDAKKNATYDAIVIGSGISGGWAAKELCEKGLKTLVLERGRDVKHVEDYPTAMKHPWEFDHHGRETWQERQANPIVNKCYAYEEATQQFFVKDHEHPYVQEKPFDWIRGYQVGGKSLIWARQTQRWSRYEFEGPAKEGVGIEWPFGYEELAPWYSHVERFVGISGNKDGIASLPDGEFLPPWELNCVEKHIKQRLKNAYRDRPVIIGRCAHLTQPTDVHLAQGRGQCQARHLCYRGCPYGGYFSSNSGTLPWAAKSGNLTLRPYGVVAEILYDDSKKRATGVRVIDTQTKEETTYFAKIIFVNAACLNTNLILLNSKSSRFPEGLGNDNGLLGKYVAFHLYRGNGFATMPGFEEEYYKGRRPTSAFIPSFRNVTSHHPDFRRGYMVAFSAGRGVGNYTASTPGFGAQFKEAASAIGPWGVFIMMQGETIPKEANHVRLAKQEDAWGIPQLITSVGYDDNDEKMVADFLKEGKAMLEEAGCQQLTMYDTRQNPGLDIHEMGGVRLGKDPKTSLLNQNNQLHNCPNVFVTDGACMPTVGNQNPSLTFMAITARAAAKAVELVAKKEL